MVAHPNLIIERYPWWLPLLWIGVAFIVLITVVIATTDNSDLSKWPSARPLTDPMVVSHVLAILPIYLSIDRRMFLTAGILSATTCVSFFYHLFMETETNETLVHMDVVMAQIVLGVVLLIWCITSTFEDSNRHVLAAAVVMGLMAAVTYLMSYDDTTEKAQCLRHRLHPLWHCIGFLGAALVIWNFVRDPRTSSFRTTPGLVRTMQTFGF